MKVLALLFTSATLLATTATAQLVATLDSFEDDAISLRLSGTLLGTPEGGFDSLFL